MMGEEKGGGDNGDKEVYYVLLNNRMNYTLLTER